MNFYRELIFLVLEICFSIFVIIFGYNLWNNFDNSNYEIAKYYASNKVIDNTNSNTIIYYEK